MALTGGGSRRNKFKFWKLKPETKFPVTESLAWDALGKTHYLVSGFQSKRDRWKGCYETESYRSTHDGRSTRI